MNLRLNKNNNNKRKVSLDGKFNDQIAFNFSYISKDKKYRLDKSNKPEKIKLMERLFFLSNMNIVDMLSLDKSKGIEYIPEKQCKCSIDSSFKTSGRNKKCGTDFCVFRLGKHGRVLGKMNNNIFYILVIDKHLNAYKH